MIFKLFRQPVGFKFCNSIRLIFAPELGLPPMRLNIDSNMVLFENHLLRKFKVFLELLHKRVTHPLLCFGVILNLRWVLNYPEELLRSHLLFNSPILTPLLFPLRVL